ncbi:MAG: GNAT family N-acetyltransferase, partial [Chloroflexota bacterium]|nr:GNAT family N-acetyltransferase [Chloroflexota bacterium]
TPDDLAAVLDLRERVFGGEQGVPDARVLDPDDHRSVHALATLDDGVAAEPVGTGRLTPGAGPWPDAQIAWVATLPEHRRHGVGAAVMRFLLDAADASGAPAVLLSAQIHALSFYKRLGFLPYGGRFHSHGIEHQLMVRRRPD